MYTLCRPASGSIETRIIIGMGKERSFFILCSIVQYYTLYITRRTLWLESDSLIIAKEQNLVHKHKLTNGHSTHFMLWSVAICEFLMYMYVH